VAGTATFSRNRIDEWTQYYDVYDGDGAWIDSTPVTHRDVPPLLTPGVIVNGEVSWSPSSWFGLDAAGRWVDRANLDNTGHDGFRTPSFFTADLQASFRLGRAGSARAPRLRVQVTNLFDQREAWPGGYSYLYFTRAAGGETLDGTAYYYPLATRSVYATVEVRF
jgi:iron complex outermembrane receptor protein